MLRVLSLALPGPPVQSRVLFPSAAAQEKGPLAFVSTHPGIPCKELWSEEGKEDFWWRNANAAEECEE